MRWLWALVLATAAAAQEPVDLAPGRAVWRPTARVTERDGRRLQAEVYRFALDAPTRLRLRLLAEGRLGLVLYRDGPGEGPRPPLGTAAPGEALELDLAIGGYVVVVAGDPPAEGAYLLSIAPPPTADGAAEAVPLPHPETNDGSLPAAARWRLPHALHSCDLSRDGDWLVATDGQAAWVYALADGTRYPLAAPAGAVRRVAVSPNGWAVLVAGESVARLYSLPDLAPIVDLPAGGELADAVFVGSDLRVALLPAGGEVTIRSPQPGDLAGLPESAGVALSGDGRGAKLVVTRADGALALFDLGRRTLIDELPGAAAPAGVALDPLRPVVIAAGAGASRLWLAEGDDPPEALPDLAAATFGPSGELAMIADRRVIFRHQQTEVELTPAVEATLVEFDDRGRLLLAATAAGEVTIWDTSPILPVRIIESGAMARARGLYEAGLAALENADYEAAGAAFTAALGLLEGLFGVEPQAPQQACLALLRLSQASYGAADYTTSVEQCERLEAMAAELDDERVRGSLIAIARYGRAEALWLLDRRDEAKVLFQAALDAGLEGERADEAKRKLAE